MVFFKPLDRAEGNLPLKLGGKAGKRVKMVFFLRVNGAGWVLVYKVFLVRIPIVREVMGFRDDKKTL